MTPRIRKVRSLAVLILVPGFWASVPEAKAGPARYDPQTRSFHFTYTYAALSENVYAGIQGIGARQKPTPEQDAKARAMVKAVSDALERATGGRARIASLDPVNDIKDADLVISLTGNPGRAGWAIPGAIEGKPGQMGLYYQYLVDSAVQDVVLSAAHELSHYLFGLTDEYVHAYFPRGCPTTNPGGPGCLMDNYLTNGDRHGWYGRYCADDHFTANPVQPKSCQTLVDQFFNQRNAPPADPGLVKESQKANVISAAGGFVRSEAEARGGSRTGISASLGSLRTLARRFLLDQFEHFGIKFNTREIGEVIKDVAIAGSKIALGGQGRITDELVKKLTETGLKLAVDFAKKSLESRRRAIRDELKKVALDAPEIGKSLTQEELRLIDQIATNTASKSADEVRFEQLVQAARVHIEADLLNLQLSIANSATLGDPGTDVRLGQLRKLRKDVDDALPGRSAVTIADPRFGVRRTVIIAPDPLDPNDDYILTQSGVHAYSEFRESCIKQFIKLVDRAKILPIWITGIEDDDQPLAMTDARFQRTRERLLSENGVQARNDRMQAIVSRVVDKVKSNQFENIIIFAPPGGLPAELGRPLDAVRDQVVGHTDLRLDVVLIDTATIPMPLRDLVMLSGGSILTIADIDEVGALAQRLRNQQSAGAWVTLPYQGTINPSDRSRSTSTKQTNWFEASGNGGEKLAGDLNETIEDVGDLLQSGDRLTYSTYQSIYSIRKALIGTDGIKKAGDESKGWYKAMWTRAKAESQKLSNDAGLKGQFSNFDPQRVDLTFVHDSFQRIVAIRSGVEALSRELSARKQLIPLPKRVSEVDFQKMVRDTYYGKVKDLTPVIDKAQGVLEELKANQLKDLFPPQEINAFAGSNRTQDNRLESRIRLMLAELRLIEITGSVRRFEREIIPFLPARPVVLRVERQTASETLRRLQTPESIRVLNEVRGLREEFERHVQASKFDSDKPQRVEDEAAKIIRLSRFYTEAAYMDQSGESIRPRFEFVLGLSRPLPSLSDPSSIPRVQLFTDDGLRVEAPFLILDEAASSDLSLVYRLELLKTHEGAWYNAALVIDKVPYDMIEDTNFTFSIASPRPNVELVATLVQSPLSAEIDPPPTNRGTVRTFEGPARVEVQVLGGTSVTGASVKGLLQKIDSGTGMILPTFLPFTDDGKGGDRTANDGVYTMLIPLDRLAQPGEFRVNLLAVSTPESKNIKVEDPSQDLAKRKSEREPKRSSTLNDRNKTDDFKPIEIPIEPALQFQRATTLHFRVER